ncbi:SDR family NAD(P)-dependent oxidoreductase [Streptomyces violaceusniger]|uniref:Short-chain dehydrogenase/reductase SDR n=1 Tax=Streptomyces violaceusniger (strain Tu 4113) TaxID=653045 RepID=G2P801_STRV4|nr:SDR family NAD(P)-dependent oxidoreductase [Streptomyces violaceusniger]AEM85662.1 short-chain dehydrogenase/reductase SDR [Streptomyces violaceusniger Tu 4113]
MSISINRLSGTVALVTGASSGIGEATARTLAGHGATVALAARRADRLDAIAADIRAAGGAAHPFPADITAEGEAAALTERVTTQLGRLDTLVNAAGIMLVGPAADAPLSEWQRNVDLNVSALLQLTHAALPHLTAAAQDSPRGVADLVNISSVAGRQAIGGASVYSATKFAVTAFSEALRQELTQQHVRVSSVEPGAVATELTDHIRDGIREMNQDWYASMETLQPDDVADAVAYIVTRPRHVALNQLLLRPTEQS